MGQKRTFWWLGYFINLYVIAANSAEITDFVASNVLADGEVETRVHYKGVTGKETSVDKGFRNGLKFRQLTDGHHFIQLIYDDDDNIRDCEYIREKSQIISFLSTFKQDLRDLLATSNITVRSLDGKSLPGFVSAWFDYAKLRNVCRQRHRDLKNLIANNSTLVENERIRSKRAVPALIMPGTMWCGQSDAAFKYTDLGRMKKTDMCCRRHDKCKTNIAPFSTRFQYMNFSPFTISHCFCDSRYKRDLSDLMRVPGTKWCGKGYSATKFTQLGGFSKTDKCCRVHDKYCPFWIGGFETKYGIFNWRVNTLMHCGCDERFRACLKIADTPDANLVGKIFFNIVQTKCFILKPKKFCAKHSWWGKCLKKKTRKQAILRDNIRFK